MALLVFGRVFAFKLLYGLTVSNWEKFVTGFTVVYGFLQFIQFHKFQEFLVLCKKHEFHVLLVWGVVFSDWLVYQGQFTLLLQSLPSWKILQSSKNIHRERTYFSVSLCGKLLLV
eukprot:TRINITY_DN14760_c0_g1_i1.p1 TRINITY_DN14760_c0_g1~~TRINITY_DN14760_c0_g1_i1.p1  ORF type:complete len:115 (-),score=9.50 TRINITY_DN14760_c0_g1_i1:128-472(-)